MTEQPFTKISVPRTLGAISSIAPAHTEDEFNGLEAMIASISSEAMMRSVPSVEIIVSPSSYQPSWMAHASAYDTNITGMKRNNLSASDYNRPDLKITF